MIQLWNSTQKGSQNNIIVFTSITMWGWKQLQSTVYVTHSHTGRCNAGHQSNNYCLSREQLSQHYCQQLHTSWRLCGSGNLLTWELNADIQRNTLKASLSLLTCNQKVATNTRLSKLNKNLSCYIYTAPLKNSSHKNIRRWTVATLYSFICYHPKLTMAENTIQQCLKDWECPSPLIVFL